MLAIPMPFEAVNSMYGVLRTPYGVDQPLSTQNIACIVQSKQRGSIIEPRGWKKKKK